MREVPAHGIEPRRWTVVFHREAENRLFDMIAMGRFKHVSAFAWLPDAGHWLIYDVGFRRTRLSMVADGKTAETIISTIVTGNVAVTVDVRDNELPWLRLGMFCTTAVAHLLGIRSSALRPDALYRHLVAKGGVILDYGTKAAAADRAGPEPRGRTGASAENAA